MQRLTGGTLRLAPRAGYAHADHLVYAVDPLTVQWNGGGTVLPAGACLRVSLENEALCADFFPADRAMLVSVWY